VRVRRFGDGDDRDLLLLLGLGNRVRHAAVRWLVERLAADYRVHAVEIPDNGTDFDRDYRRPVECYAAGLDADYRLLSHSTGGLIAAHLSTDRPRVYCSPWWGFAPGRDAALATLLARLPVEAPVLPVPPDADAYGDAVDTAGRETTWISPAFVRAIGEAQAALAGRPVPADATVFCSLADRVVSVRAIGERTPPDRVRLYDGGHEFFASAERGAILEEVRRALAAPG
jgi:hypothetical protein